LVGGASRSSCDGTNGIAASLAVSKPIEKQVKACRLLCRGAAGFSNRSKKVKIAQISPLMESVPPENYGGSERIVSYLTEELVALGHQVTLFASGNSSTGADLVPCTDESLRLKEGLQDVVPYHLVMLERVRQRAAEFDILHFHIDQYHFPIFRGIAGKTLTTLHGRQDLPDLNALYSTFTDMPLISISEDQRKPIAQANFVATIYHGLPEQLLRPSFASRGNYLAFLGRICPEKRPDLAIKIARAAGLPLKIAAKVDRVDETYFAETIRPLLDGPDVEFVGEIGDEAKAQFLGDAAALLFPIDWPEPFGLVLIEAMACGTPVLAFRRGSIPEIVENGLTGLIVDTVDEAVAAIPRLLSLDRRAIRKRFEERFTARRMAEDYCRVYEGLLGRWRRRAGDLVLPQNEGG
jgi:glycosyltransferase involved in cell wall biosynthesis